MLARKQKNTRLNRAVLTAAKRTLKERGWTYRTAAPICKVKFEHFAKVLSGVRVSSILLRRIDEIPPRDQQASDTNTNSHAA